MKNKQFTCPVSMAVTEEQFNADLRQPLEKLGYEIRNLNSFEEMPYLITNRYDKHNQVTNYYKDDCCDYGNYLIDHYNPQLFLALASLTTESTETKEQVLARFEKGIERELIGYRFRNNDFNKISFKALNHRIGKHPLLGGKNFQQNSNVYRYLRELNLLETFCEPVYKEIETISISEAEKVLKGFGREVKIDKDLK